MMSQCPICEKDIPEDAVVHATSAGACSICKLDLTTDTRAVEYEQTSDEKARIAELQRLHRIAYGPEPRSAKMTRVKGFLALTIIVCIIVYVYIWDKHKQENEIRGRVDITLRAFNVIFGPDSPLSDDEKVEEFKYFRMSPVTSKGTISYVNLGQNDDLYVTVSVPSRIASSDILIRFTKTWRDRLSDLKVGQSLRFSGRISEFDRGTSFITLKQGRILGEPL